MTELEFEQTEIHTWDEWGELLRDKEHSIPCVHIGCERKACDRHHLDGNHSNPAPDNLVPVCKLCHNKVHGITANMTALKVLVRQFYDLQDGRKRMGNRVSALEGLDLSGIPTLDEAASVYSVLENRMQKLVARQLAGIPIYDEWLSKVKGVGPLLAGSLIAELEAPDKYRGIRSIRAYCGQDVRDGKAPRRKRGEKANWNPRLRVTLWKVGNQFVKTVPSYGRDLYEGYRAYYEDREGTSVGAHNWARRKVAKKFLDCLWVKWREIEGLAVSDPAPGETVTPEMWVDGKNEKTAVTDGQLELAVA